MSKYVSKREKNDYMVTLEREKETNAKITQEVKSHLNVSVLSVGKYPNIHLRSPVI